MIKTLSPEVEKKLIEYRDRWFQNSISTQKENNDEKIKTIIKQAYDLLKLEHPQNWISLQSPYEGIIALSILSYFYYNQDQPLNESSWDKLWESRLSIVRTVKSFQFYHVMKKILKIHKYNNPIEFEESAAAIEFKTVDRIKLLANDDMDEGFRSQLKKDIYIQLENYDENKWKEIFYKLIESLPNDFQAEQIGQYIGNSYGSMEEIVLCRLQYYYEVLNIERYAILEPFYNLQSISGWWWAFKNFVILTPKPNTIQFDESGTLHRVGSKAVEYPDNYGLYRVHGVEVPDEWANTKGCEWKSQWLLNAKNAEHRMALIKVLGYEKIMKELNSVLIHGQKDTFGHQMELRKIENDIDLEAIVLLKVVCPTTYKTHVLRVPPEMNHCEEARRWTFFDQSMKMDFLLET